MFFTGFPEFFEILKRRSIPLMIVDPVATISPQNTVEFREKVNF